MSKEELNMVVETTKVAIDPEAILAEVYKEGDDYFIRNLSDDVVTGPLKVDVNSYICLPKNDSNRKWVKTNVVDKAEGQKVGLTYKESKHFGSVITNRRIPNSALLNYLSEEEQAEVKAIFDKAYDAMAADKAKAKPVTDAEKLKAKIAKLQAQLEEAMKASE